MTDAQWAPSDPSEWHVDGKCWCRPVVVYRSKVTKGRVVVHRGKHGAAPSPETLALARWYVDSPEAPPDQDVGNHARLTLHG